MAQSVLYSVPEEETAGDYRMGNRERGWLGSPLMLIVRAKTITSIMSCTQRLSSGGPVVDCAGWQCCRLIAGAGRDFYCHAYDL